MNVLKEARLAKGLTLEEVGDIVGVGKSTVRKWETGFINNMGRDKIVKLAKALDISPLQVLEVEEGDIIYDLSTIYLELTEVRKERVLDFATGQLIEQQHANQNKVRKIKTIDNSYIAANPSVQAYGDSIVSEKEYEENAVPKGAEFAIRVKGDSMEPLIKDDQMIFYKRTEQVENGEIAVVEIDGEGVTCKKVYFDLEKEEIILKSLNEKYENRHISNENIKIIGKVLFI